MCLLLAHSVLLPLGRLSRCRHCASSVVLHWSPDHRRFLINLASNQLLKMELRVLLQSVTEMAVTRAFSLASATFPELLFFLQLHL